MCQLNLTAPNIAKFLPSDFAGVVRTYNGDAWCTIHHRSPFKRVAR